MHLNVARKWRGILLWGIVALQSATSSTLLAQTDLFGSYHESVFEPPLGTDFESSTDIDLQAARFAHMQPGASATQPPSLPPAPQTRRVPPAAPSRTRVARRRRSSNQLLAAPDLFGDLYAFGNMTLTDIEMTGPISTVDMPLAGGSRNIKICEHNSALPRDRVYFIYNHFHNALDASFVGPGGRSSSGIDRYLIGAERTFFDGLGSVEIRMPFTNSFQFSIPEHTVFGGQIGNLSVIVKTLMIERDTWALASGLGINTPTGSDVIGILPFDSATYNFGNQAVHLTPFTGMLLIPTPRTFVQAFAQLDVPTNGNTIVVSDMFSSATQSAILNEPTVAYFDLSLGMWLYRNPNTRITGVALSTEFHYTTSLQDADTVVFSVADMAATSSARFDILNLTTGLNFEVDRNTDVRIGGVFPMRGTGHRFFDSEFQFSVTRRY